MEVEKINKKPTLSLNYIFENKNPTFSKVIIENREYSLEEVNNREIQINFTEIEEELGSKILNVRLKNPYDNIIQNFEIISDKNTGILFPTLGCTRDLIFPKNISEKLKVKIISTLDGQKREFDIENNRLLLINFSNVYKIYINEINISSQILNSSSSQGDSTQISVVDLQNRIVLYKSILPQQFDLFFKAYDRLKGNAKYFMEECGDFFNKNKFNFDEYKNLFFKDELIDILFYKYNLPKNILKKEYNKKDYFEFISSCALYFIMSTLKEEEKEEKEIKSTYEYFIKYKNNLEKDLHLEYYMRNIIIMELAIYIIQKNNLEKFKKSEFKYYITKDLEKDSPLEEAIIFLDNFIKDLDETSPFIYPLILIDSGNYSYGKENAYGFGLINREILKSHLQNIIPDIIITINDEEINSEEAITSKNVGSVVLNLASEILSPLKYYKIDKKIEDKVVKYNLGLILFITLFHEIFGHKKGGYSSKSDDICKSPNVFYDQKEKRILKLINRNCNILNDSDVPILRDERKEDAGHFLEYFIGKCEYGFYSEMIEEMLLKKVNLNFIFNVQMWNKDIEIMRNYIRLKYIVFIYDENLLDKKEYQEIGIEIKELEKIIKENKIDLNNLINDINKEGNKRKEYTNVKKSELFKRNDMDRIEYERFENYSLKELLKIAKNKETSKTLRKLIYKIIFSRILKK